MGMLAAILIQPVFLRDFAASKLAMQLGLAFACLASLGVAIVALRLHRLGVWVSGPSVSEGSPIKKTGIWSVVLAAFFGVSWLFFCQPASRLFTQAIGTEGEFSALVVKFERSSQRGCKFTLRFVGPDHPFAFRQCLSRQQYTDLPSGTFVVRFQGQSSGLGTLVTSFTVER